MRRAPRALLFTLAFMAPLVACTAILGDYAAGTGVDGSVGDAGADRTVSDGRTNGKDAADGSKSDGRKGDSSLVRDGGHPGDVGVTADTGADTKLNDAGCSAGEVLCPGSGCTSTQMDPRHCGTCGNDCTSALHVTGTSSCSGGACVYSCAPGFADNCGDGGPGCSTSLGTPANCGSCGHACPASTPYCSAPSVDGGTASCTSTCSGGTPNLCNGSCVNSQTDPQNCGASCSTCSFYCTNGGCTGDCNKGTTGCTGTNTTTPWTCPSGTKVNGPITPGTCNAQCSPDGGTGCGDGSVPETCDTTGKWLFGPVTRGQCGAVCTPFTDKRCVSHTQESCGSAGQWNDSGTITAGTCDAACTPGAVQCPMGAAASETCDKTGEWADAAACPGVKGGCCLNACSDLASSRSACTDCIGGQGGQCAMTQMSLPICDSDGGCSCPPPYGMCMGFCMLLDTQMNCGTCFHFCMPGTTCVAGNCQ